MTTVPAHSFSAPARAWVIAAARFMPGVWAVLMSSSFEWTTRMPSSRQRASLPLSIGQFSSTLFVRQAFLHFFGKEVARRARRHASLGGGAADGRRAAVDCRDDQR